MGYGSWGPWPGVRAEPQEFAERGWKRKPLADWDARWEKLSVPARAAFLMDVKAPPQGYAAGSPNAGVAVDKLAPAVLKELTDAGFVRIVPTTSKAKPDRVMTVEAASGFRVRIRALQRIKLLDPKEPGDVHKYINVACYPSRLNAFVSGVIGDAGPGIHLADAEALMYLTSSRWPDLALKAIKDPVAEKVLDVVRASEKPVPLADLANRVKKADPVQVREALDKLVAHLAVFEDLNVKTHAIEVGLLPAVRKRIAEAATRTGRPPLVVCPTPRALGPDGGPLVDDLRALLLEVASEPPRLRQDGEIFSKEKERFHQALGPVADWLAAMTHATHDSRLDKAYAEASTLKLVKEHRDGKEMRLQLTPRGKAWLTAETKDQYAQVYEAYRSLPKQESGYYHDDDLDDFINPYISQRYNYYYGYSVLTDRTFLGAAVSVLPPRTETGKKAARNPTTRDIEALRASIGRALDGLPEGVYHRLDSVIEHFAFRDENVLLMGHKQEDVRIYYGGHPIPALEEAREETARKTLNELILTRLIPLGALRATVDGEGKLCVARTGRLAAYFGIGPMPDEPAAAAGSGSKVVVQPDFSVVVIGLSSAALAELAPFCDRSGSGGKVPGASVLKITRESVTRAIAQGLKTQQILDRLRKHASHEPPANVLREVRDWGGWVKSIAVARLTVIRCPDRETADRVIGALKSQVERLNETTLSLDAEKLTAIERKKLKDHGILIGTLADLPADAAATPRNKKAAKRRYS